MDISDESESTKWAAFINSADVSATVGDRRGIRGRRGLISFSRLSSLVRSSETSAFTSCRGGTGRTVGFGEVFIMSESLTKHARGVDCVGEQEGRLRLRLTLGVDFVVFLWLDGLEGIVEKLYFPVANEERVALDKSGLLNAVPLTLILLPGTIG